MYNIGIDTSFFKLHRVKIIMMKFSMSNYLRWLSLSLSLSIPTRQILAITKKKNVLNGGLYKKYSNYYHIADGNTIGILHDTILQCSSRYLLQSWWSCEKRSRNAWYRKSRKVIVVVSFCYNLGINGTVSFQRFSFSDSDTWKRFKIQIVDNIAI